MTLGQYIKTAREAKGINVTELARVTKRAVGFCGKLESGSVAPSPKTVRLIAKYLGIEDRLGELLRLAMVQKLGELTKKYSL